MAVLEVLSVENEFSVWIPSRNKFYVGDNRAKALISDDLPNGIPFRGTHIFEAIFPQSIKLDSPEFRFSVEEARDAGAKYYVLSIYRESIAQEFILFAESGLNAPSWLLPDSRSFSMTASWFSDIHIRIWSS